MPPPDSRRRLLAGLWGTILLGCALLLGWLLRDGLPADTRLTAMLPEDRRAPLVERADDQLGQAFAERFVLLLDAPSLAEAAADLAATLQAAGGERPLLERLDWRASDLADGGPGERLGESRYRLLTGEVRRAIDADGGRSLVAPALRALFSPAAPADPVADPFGLRDRWLAARATSPVQARDGLLTVVDDDRSQALMIGHLAASPYDLAAQASLTSALDAFRASHPEATLTRSGLVFHAAAGARQARGEITTIGLGALAGLLGALLAVFRSPRAIAQMLLPLATGLLLALPLTLLLFGRLHLLTLAFGASLIGIAIDYALHLQCRRAVQGRHFRLPSLLPALALGLASSLVAYLAQALTPMPGLRQMAVFAALGLAGAWLTVVLWLPRLRLDAPPATARLARGWWRRTGPRGGLSPRLALVGLLLVVGLIAWRLDTDDSLALLNPSPAELLAEERALQALLGRDTGRRYLLVTAADEPRLLERLEGLGTTLDRWRDQGAGFTVHNLADSVPSPARQAADLERVRRLYDEPLAELVARAGLPPRTLDRARARLEAVPLLDVEAWLASPLGRHQRRLWLGESPDGVAALILLTDLPAGDAAEALDSRLQALADARPGVTYVDRAARLGRLLGELRGQIAGWLGGALALLALSLTWRYRGRTWRVLTPPLGGVLGVLGVYALAGVPLNVFSQLGLLLVLGIGLDAGIFGAEAEGRAATWLAISLSTLTSLLAFGLLAFSATPALHYLGLSCLIGLALVWCLVRWAAPGTETSPAETADADTP
ncbi:MMPL family transporter [Halomonas nitroreducens]|uniref:Membrane transport protein MMPL domain-containing protein n=1 Tax=Halomonas nitroreducens TaxID=447425 RepID=A0A431V8W5_9GAMM|nr:hypothetical protein [Halomonas nitroreducens]RTR07121.1 hypothetical protein EKG36_01330 [Halomonas nitroreducens]